MSEAKFTKGKWKIQDDGYGLIGVILKKGLGILIGRKSKETQANAHLIAAAPNLYHALKRTNEELALLIDLYNKEVKDPAHFIDAETCYLNNIELAKARGEQ